jgi:hypothetical protein
MTSELFAVEKYCSRRAPDADFMLLKVQLLYHRQAASSPGSDKSIPASDPYLSYRIMADRP